jgi:hypothetical protein
VLLPKNTPDREIVPLPILSFLVESQQRNSNSPGHATQNEEDYVNFIKCTICKQIICCASSQEHTRQGDCSAPDVVIFGRITVYVAGTAIHLGIPHKTKRITLISCNAPYVSR